MPTLSPCLRVFGNQKHAFKVRSSSNETKDSFVAIYFFGNNVLQLDIGQYLNMPNQSKYCMRKLSCGTRDNISYKQVVDSAHIEPLRGKRDISKIVGTQPAMFVFLYIP